MYKSCLFLLLLSCLLCAGVWAGEEGKVDPAIHFRAVDLWVDSSDNELGAYQVEITYDADTVKIVGIEGGETEAFRTPPYYDEKGFEGGRIILAAFASDDEVCPQGRTRVARIHLAVETTNSIRLNGELMAAAKKGGKRFSPDIELRAAPKGGGNEE